MTRGLFVLLGLIALFGACTQRLICPAYQSSFIYDKETLRQKFSYFKEDSTPKILTASKNKYLVAVPESYRKKLRRLQTVEMKPIYPIIPDSLKTDFDPNLLLAELDSADSVTDKTIEPGDSAYAITKTKEKYNLDQDLYMWYFRDVLVLPDVRAALEGKENKKDEGAPGKAGKKEKQGFFKSLKNLFKKKPKTDSTGAVIEVPVKKDSTDVNAPEPKKKGGLFKKKKPQPEKKKTDPAKKEGGDGF